MKNYKLFLGLALSFLLALPSITLAAAPIISPVKINDSSSRVTVPAGTSFRLTWYYTDFGKGNDANFVSLQACRPGGSCAPLKYVTGVSDINLIPTPAGSSAMTAYRTVLSDIYADPSLFDAEGKTLIKICPATASGALPSGGAKCGYSPYLIIPSAVTPVTPSLPIAETPIYGTWGSWSACSATVANLATCAVGGTQTRSCVGGNGQCLNDQEGGASKTCYPASCSVTVSPKIDSFNANQTLGTWPAGTTKTIPFTYSGFSSDVNKVQISLCKNTQSSACSVISTESVIPTANSTSTVQVLGNPDGRLYARLLSHSTADAAVAQYYNNLSAYYRICPFNSRTNKAVEGCKFVDFTVGPGVNYSGWSGWSACSATACGQSGTQTQTCSGSGCAGVTTRTQSCSAPACSGQSVVSMIRVEGVNEGTPSVPNTWSVGISKNISYTYFGFNEDVKTVSVSFCNPTTMRTTKEKCSLFAQADNKVLSWVYGESSPSTRNISRAVGPKVYQRLASGDTTITPYYDNYQAVVKICPTDSLGRNVGTFSNCAYSPVFKVVDPNVSNSTTWDVPSGQGCFVGECVCVNNKNAVCGNPMQDGGSCALAGCTGGTYRVSMASKMMASVSSLTIWLSSLVSGIIK